MSAVSSLGTLVSEAPLAPQSTAEVVARLYAAFVTGDIEGAAGMIASDFVGHVPGRGRNAGEYWGVDGFHQFMTNITGYNGGVFDVHVPVFSVGGEDAFTREVIEINRAHDPERLFTLRLVNWLKVRDGRISEHWVIPEDQHVYDDYWSGPAPGGARVVRAARESLPSRSVLDSSNATSEPARRVVAHMYERFWRGDADGMKAGISPNVIVNIVGRSDISGVYEGWAGYLAFRSRLMAIAGDKYRLDVVALAASERDVWATERIRMNRSWDSRVTELFVQMHFEVEGELIVRIDDFPLDTHAWEQFYTRPRD
jgi:ketosteroid isomerase-like protein